MRTTSLFLLLFYLTFALALSDKDYPAAGQRRNELFKKLGLRPEARGQQVGGVNPNADFKMSEFPLFPKGFIPTAHVT